MSEELHYYVDFLADFQRPESWLDAAGEELAEILCKLLPLYGVRVIGMEEDGPSFCVHCLVKETRVVLGVGAEFEDELDGRWYVMPLGGRTDIWGRDRTPKGVYRKLLLAVDSVLRDSKFDQIRWFPCVETAEYRSLLPRADSPIKDLDYEKHKHPLIQKREWLCRLNGLLLTPIAIIPLVVLVAILGNVFHPSAAVLVFFPWFFWLVFSSLFLSSEVSCESARMMAAQSATGGGSVEKFIAHEKREGSSASSLNRSN